MSILPSQTTKGKTPHWSTSGNGYEGVVKRLLQQNDRNPDKRDNNTKTAVWGAAWDGHERVVNLLFARDDVNPDKPDTDGGTPVFWPS